MFFLKFIIRCIWKFFFKPFLITGYSELQNIIISLSGHDNIETNCIVEVEMLASGHINCKSFHKIMMQVIEIMRFQRALVMTFEYIFDPRENLEDKEFLIYWSSTCYYNNRSSYNLLIDFCLWFSIISNFLHLQFKE